MIVEMDEKRRPGLDIRRAQLEGSKADTQRRDIGGGCGNTTATGTPTPCPHAQHRWAYHKTQLCRAGIFALPAGHQVAQLQFIFNRRRTTPAPS
jgi:hypothetical protein